MYRWAEHTGEVELSIEAPSAEAVFCDALAALAELLGPDGESGAELTRDVALEAPDRAALLAAWIDELVFLSETEHAVPDHAEELELSAHGLRARVRLRAVESPPSLVKAATYHRLSFESAETGWRARVVLDV
jgi:SHS2 domain-containing protein